MTRNGARARSPRRIPVERPLGWLQPPPRLPCPESPRRCAPSWNGRASVQSDLQPDPIAVSSRQARARKLTLVAHRRLCDAAPNLNLGSLLAQSLLWEESFPSCGKVASRLSHQTTDARESGTGSAGRYRRAPAGYILRVPTPRCRTWLDGRIHRSARQWFAWWGSICRVPRRIGQERRNRPSRPN